MPDDPLDIIAASYKTIADTQQILAQTQLRLEETQRALAQTHRLGLRLQGFALALLGLSLLGTGGLVWQHLAMRTTPPPSTRRCSPTPRRLRPRRRPSWSGSASRKGQR